MNDSESSSDESKWTVVTNKALRKKKARSTLKKLFPNLEGASVKTTISSYISPQDSAYRKMLKNKLRTR